MSFETSTENKNPSFFDRVKRFAAPISQTIRDRISIFMQATQEKPKPPREPFIRTQLTFNNLQSDLSPIAHKMVLLKLVFSRLFKTPQIETLINRAFDGAPFTLSFVDSSKLYSQGECNFTQRQININKNLNLRNMVSTFLYELCNANNTKLKDTLTLHFNNEDDYALAIESAEFSSYQQHIALLSALLNDQDFVSTLEGVGENVDELLSEVNNAFQTFDEYWKDANQSNKDNDVSHSDYYRHYYRKHLCFQPAKAVTMPASAPITPAFIATQNTNSQATNDILAVHFKSTAAKEFFTEISKNQQAIAMLRRIPASITATLANNVTLRNLQGYKALNLREQAVFISQYAQRKMQTCLSAANKQRSTLTSAF